MTGRSRAAGPSPARLRPLQPVHPEAPTEVTVIRTILVAVSAAAVLLPGCAATTPRPVARTCFHEDVAFETEVGYCQAVRSGQTLYVSGNTAKGDMPAAIHKVYADIQKTLEANGLSFADVVKENVYSTDLDAFIQNKAVRKEFYANTALPAATWVQVQRLYRPSLVLEVEVVAQYPK
jgi:enamine deaminase RidA (YjgF/YER057c/UK114 family)